MDDLKIKPDGDSLDILIKDGEPELASGLDNAVYLSLFTGDYWGNVYASADGRYTSRISEIMGTGLLTLRTRQAIIDEAKRALDWMITTGIASRVDVMASIPEPDRLHLKIMIEQSGDTTSIVYGLNWQSQVIAVLEGAA